MYFYMYTPLGILINHIIHNISLHRYRLHFAKDSDKQISENKKISNLPIEPLSLVSFAYT